MARTKTLTLRNVRASELDMQDALKLLRKKLPKAKVAKLEIDDSDHYVAHVIVSEFPPPKGGPKEEPAFEDGGDGDGDGDGDSDDEPDGDDGGSPDGPPDAKGDGEGKGGKEEKLLSLVEMIAQHLGIDPAMADAGDVGPAMPPGPELPDVGAPSKGPMPPGGGADRPLPPPVNKPAAPGMGAAFAKRTITAWREDPNGNTSVEEVIKEAAAFFPGYRVAKVERHMGKGENGYEGPVLLTALVKE